MVKVCHLSYRCSVKIIKWSYHAFQGANILVDNKGCIKLADFGASKRVAKLVNAPKMRQFFFIVTNSLFLLLLLLF